MLFNKGLQQIIWSQLHPNCIENRVEFEHKQLKVDLKTCEPIPCVVVSFVCASRYSPYGFHHHFRMARTLWVGMCVCLCEYIRKYYANTISTTLFASSSIHRWLNLFMTHKDNGQWSTMPVEPSVREKGHGGGSMCCLASRKQRWMAEKCKLCAPNLCALYIRRRCCCSFVRFVSIFPAGAALFLLSRALSFPAPNHANGTSHSLICAHVRAILTK